MSTLLDSRAHHRRVCVLSRKARESEIFNEEPRNRRRLFNPESVSDNSVERLRTCQDDTENVCFSNVFARSPVTENVLRQTSSRSRRQAGQLRRQDNVRKKKAGTRRIRELQPRPIMPCVRHTSRDRREQSADFPQSDNVQRSQEVDHIIERTSTRHWRQRGQQRRRQRENNEDDAVGMINDDQLPLPVARQRYTEPEQRHDLGPMTIGCTFCGAHHWMAERVSNSSSQSPEFTACCQRGHVDISHQSDPPDTLYNLFEGHDEDDKEFREHIRQYNMALAFTSLGVTEDKIVNRRGGWVFRVQGELCHLIGSLRPDDGVAPSYAQLYIYDAQLALAQRMNRNDNLARPTMDSLQSMLLRSHKYATDFKHTHELLEEFPNDSDATIRLRVMPGQDERRYNLPSSEEVSVILPGDGTAPQRRDIVLRARSHDNSLTRIDDGHPAYTPLHYVILFPYGDHGWHRDLYHRPVPGTAARDGWKPPRISQTQYSAFRLHTHNQEYSSIHRGGRLFQQYIVDMWASADQTRLAFLRFNQGRLRATLYSGFEDWLAADEVGTAHDLGKRVVLPSSYIGGPRHQQQQYQDAMAIARFYKKIDLFITMTANPNWPEITRELFPGQTSYDRPDIVARVFKLKKEELLNDIYKKQIFGRVVAYVYVIEFQKRGLPHLHLLVALESNKQLHTASDIDSCITAQWPDPSTEPLLFTTVKSTMVHGPCGNLNRSAPCMKNGRCTKGYPKPLQEYTSTTEDGYPLYARPNNGRSHSLPVSGIGNVELDNGWIVPYNAYISAKYNCHTNVESVASFRTIKYCFKYIHKGPDRATLEYDRDEIKQYIDGRYIGAPEGVWRILHYEVHKHVPSIERLQVHLPGQHMVVFDPDEPVQAIMARASAERTTLTQFFYMNTLLNDVGNDARLLTYQDFPHSFVWHKDSKTWTKRQKGFSLGWMYFVPPTGGERFYLRTLLSVVRGPKSFTDLRTFEGVQYPTFHDACRARGLLHDDGEWLLCLSEASQIQSGTSLRYLFASMLLFCQLTAPENLWLRFRDDICDDLSTRVPNPTMDRVYDYGLFLLNHILSESGYDLNRFPNMPSANLDWSHLIGNNLITEQLSYDIDAELHSFQELIDKIQAVPEQLFAYESIVHAVLQRTGTCFFLSGPAGTGKTYVYNTVCHRLRSEGKIVICVASSGIAALLLPGGRTAHSTFQIPLDNLDSDSTCNISKQDKRADLLRSVDLIIWDEAPTQSRFTQEALDRTMRDVCDNEFDPFGGKTVVLGGDFLQTLPILPNSSQEEIINICLPRSHLWKHFKVLRLEKNMRLAQSTAEERQFATWLLDVGHGTNIDPDGTIPFDVDMRVPDPETLIRMIYPNIDQVLPPPSYFLDRIILAPRNSDVDNLNSAILNKFPGHESTFYSAESIQSEPGVYTDSDIPVEYLRSIEASGLPPGELHVKLGCPLIVLRNIAPGQGLCNGTRVILLHASGRVLKVQIVGGQHDGEICFIPRITLIPSSQPGLSFHLRRRQFPVRLAFALTINKAQGQSVRHVGIDLREPVFTHGQLYVALSRATSHLRVKLLILSSTSAHRVHNIVYRQIFHMIGHD